MLLDGNHRYQAVTKLRANDINSFMKLPCRIYKTLTVKQALGTAFAKNKDSEDVLKMSDYERVMVIRKVMKETKEDADLKSYHTSIYELLGAYDVSISCILNALLR